MFQEGLQLTRVIGKNWDEFFRICLKSKSQKSHVRAGPIDIRSTEDTKITRSDLIKQTTVQTDFFYRVSAGLVIGA